MENLSNPAHHYNFLFRKMKIPETAFEFLKITRSCTLTPYLDQDGNPAQGWGQKYRINGNRVSMSGPAITQSEADEWFQEILLRDFWPTVQNIPGFSLMADEQRAALLSFCMDRGYSFNAFGFEDLTTALENRNYNEICTVLVGPKYTQVDGEYSLEQARLRYAETLLWRGATPVNAWEKARRIGLGHLAEAIA